MILGIFHAPILVEDSKFIEFPEQYNTMLWRDPSASPVKIYMREQNLKIAQHLDEFVASKDHLFYLLGPPGVGKTKLSLFWVMQSVVKRTSDTKDFAGPWAWVALTMSGSICEVYLFNRVDTSADVAIRYGQFQPSDLAIDLYYLGVKVVVFDNCCERNSGLVGSCSQTLGIKTVAVTSELLNYDYSFSRQQAMTLHRWEEADYLEACKDDDFYTSVKANLKTEDFSEEELNDPTMRAEVVAAKYHLAGGCARWMFEYSVDELLNPVDNMPSIEFFVNRVSRDEIFTGFRGNLDNSEVNQLLFPMDDGHTVIVSQYVANRLVARHGVHLLQQALGWLGEVNPWVVDMLMVMDFMHRLGKSTFTESVSIDLVMEYRAEPVPVLQSGGKKIPYCLSTFATAVGTVSDGDWFIPRIVHHGGFDCVQYRAGKLIFVQVARSGVHALKLKWYEKFRSVFVETFPALTVAQCEVWFVVQKELVGTFTPAEPSGKLTGYEEGTHKVAGLRHIGGARWSL